MPGFTLDFEHKFFAKHGCVKPHQLHRIYTKYERFLRCTSLKSSFIVQTGSFSESSFVFSRLKGLIPMHLPATIF